MIPIQLQKEELKFCKILPKSKRPFEKDWANNGYTYTDIDTSTGNYGVIGGYGGLIIIDSDTQELQEVVDTKLPKTFRVRTGSGGCHDYYFCKDLKKKLVLSKNGKHYGEVQSWGTQVVGPGSTHPNGNIYEIENNIDIAEVVLSELIKIIKPFTEEFNEKIEWTKSESSIDSEYDVNVIDMRTVIDGKKFEKQYNGEYLGPNPWHGSTTGVNFCLNPEKNIAYCFRCRTGVNVTQAISMNEGITKSCNEKLTKEQFLKVVKIAQEKYGLKKKEKIENLLSFKNEILTDIIKDRNSATEKLVKYILKENYIYTTRSDERNEMWIYNEGIYIPEGKTRVGEICRKILEEAYTSQILTAVITKLEVDTAIDQEVFFEAATQNVNEIPIKNGIFDLVNKTLNPFDPKKIFFNKLPIFYSPEAKCPNIEQHLKDVLKSEDDIEVMYELFGYLLWKDHFIEKAFMMVGDGRNGKGKTIDLMKRFIGIENCCSIPLINLSGDTFRLSELFGKMANIAGDLSNTALKDTGTFKQITGRDLIGAKRKFKNTIIFTNYSKQVFACNELPRVYDYSRGWFSRFLIFEFPYVFLDETEYKKSFLPNKKKMNPSQIEKISTPEELSGLFNKAIEKLDLIRKNKNFSNSLGTEGVKQFWVRNSDSFAAFCMDNLEEKYDGIITKKDLRKAYHNYCKKHSLKGTSDKSMKIVLEQEFGAIEARPADNSGGQDRVWEGITFKEKSLYSYQK